MNKRLLVILSLAIHSVSLGMATQKPSQTETSRAAIELKDGEWCKIPRELLHWWLVAASQQGEEGAAVIDYVLGMEKNGYHNISCESLIKTPSSATGAAGMAILQKLLVPNDCTPRCCSTFSYCLNIKNAWLDKEKYPPLKKSVGIHRRTIPIGIRPCSDKALLDQDLLTNELGQNLSPEEKLWRILQRSTVSLDYTAQVCSLELYTNGPCLSQPQDDSRPEWLQEVALAVVDKRIDDVKRWGVQGRY